MNIFLCNSQSMIQWLWSNLTSITMVQFKHVSRYTTLFARVICSNITTLAYQIGWKITKHIKALIKIASMTWNMLFNSPQEICCLQLLLFMHIYLLVSELRCKNVESVFKCIYVSGDLKWPFPLHACIKLPTPKYLKVVLEK